jgi:hypothetical protein
MRRRRNFILIGISCLIMAGAVWLGLSGDNEPVYKGRSLSWWLYIYGGMTAFDRPSYGEAAEAVRNIGTNALPTMLRWICFEPSQSKWRRKLEKDLEMLPVPRVTRPFREWLGQDVASIRAQSVLSGFEILGPVAAPAAPELGRLANDPTHPFTAIRATAALAHIGPAALPQLLTVITNTRAITRDIAIATISDFESPARAVIPSLLQCLSDKNPAVARMAAGALGELKLEPGLVVPALCGVLGGTNSSLRACAAEALEEFGGQAKSAAPILVAALADPDHSMRTAATNALAKIAPEMLVLKVETQPTE